MREQHQIIGIIKNISSPVSNVEEGMLFAFDGKNLRTFKHDALDDNDKAKIFFNSIMETDTIVNSFVECEVSATAEIITFHISGTPHFGDGVLQFAVTDYWILEPGTNLKDVTEAVYSGLCIDSFCPMDAVSFHDDGSGPGLHITSANSTIRKCGQTTISGKEVKLETMTGWSMKSPLAVQFKSSLHVAFESADYELLRTLYIAVARSIRFCIGRGNVELECKLLSYEDEKAEVIGEFVACHGRTYIPDEYDESHEMFIRAKDIGDNLALVLKGCAEGAIEHPSFAENREETDRITYAKVIELTAAFERDFTTVFPDGVVHSKATLKAQADALSALQAAKKGVNAKARGILKNISAHIEDDNLQTRISGALKMMPEDVTFSIKHNLSNKVSEGNVGERIASVRNSVAHGSAYEYELKDISEEYHLLIRLVYTLRFMRIGVADADIPRLIKCIL